MINDLRITNGLISPSFDSLINLYTVNIDEEINIINFEYDVSNEYSISVVDNNDLKDGSEVLLFITDILGNEETYKFIVNKERSVTTFDGVSELQKLEVANTTEVPSYVVPLMISIGLVLILIMFKILFIKRKKRG